MMKVRVSTMEAYRRVVEDEFGNEEELVAAIQGQPFEPRWQMQAGTAWHAILADPAEHKTADGETWSEADLYYRCGQYSFAAPAVAASLEHVGPGIYEITAQRVWNVWGRPVLVEGTADLVRGLVVQDHKTKFSNINARDYEPSIQWRFYLCLHHAQAFRYNLFDFKDPKDGFCELKDIVSFRFWRYSGMEEECREWLGRFLDFCDGRRLTEYLTPRAA